MSPFCPTPTFHFCPIPVPTLLQWKDLNFFSFFFVAMWSLPVSIQFSCVWSFQTFKRIYFSMYCGFSSRAFASSQTDEHCIVLNHQDVSWGIMTKLAVCGSERYCWIVPRVVYSCGWNVWNNVEERFWAFFFSVCLTFVCMAISRLCRYVGWLVHNILIL